MKAKEIEEAGLESDHQIETLLRYAPTRVLLSGWIKEPKVIERRAAWMHVTHGEGRIHLFGFRPQYRGWSQATFPLLFRALFLNRPDRQDGKDTNGETEKE
jgi:hypothetical protein